MRIIKLSTDEFPTVENLLQYFFAELPSRNPKGQFLVTPDRIALDAFNLGERLVFTHKAKVVFSAISKTSLIPYDGKEKIKYQAILF